MRAIYLKNTKEIKSGDILNIEGEKAHHLLKVARIKKGEDLFIFNGNGLKITAKVNEIKKKELSLNVLDVSHEIRRPLL